MPEEEKVEATAEEVVEEEAGVCEECGEDPCVCDEEDEEVDEEDEKDEEAEV